MKLTRTRTLAIGIIALFVVIGAACGAELASESGGGGDAPPLRSGLNASGDGPTSDGAPEAAAPVELDAGEPAYASDDASVTRDGSGGIEPGPELQSVLDRKIILSTSVDVDVEEVNRSFQDVIRFAQAAGGFVASSTFSNQDEQQMADLTIRVPAASYQDVLGKVRGMGEVRQESSDANDVTEEFTDLQARLRTLERTEGRYLELLAQAETIDEILTVQDRLDGVRGQIEQVQGRINLLEHLTDLATITVHLRPLVVAADAAGETTGPLEAAADAWALSLDTLRGLATAVLVAAAFSWWLLPPLLVVGLVTRWWLARRPQPSVEASV